MADQEEIRERLKATIQGVVEKKADESGKTKLDVLKAIRKGQRMRLPGVN
ncbi:hypothetical protein [Draconibacterium mangrovi]|nr:hypothetical protein [Draconibacterium mangrovi]